MVKIPLQQFNGELPRTQAHYLPEGYAVSARNAKLTSGSLRAMRGGLSRHSFTTPGKQAVVQHNAQWFGFDVDVDAAPGAVASDRLYLTRAVGAPQLYAGSAWLPLALPNPATGPTITVSGTPEDPEDVVYAYTWVTELGEESGPSPLSNAALFGAGSSVSVAGMTSATSVDGRPVAQKRIYRARTTASGATELMQIAEVPASATAFTDAWGVNPDREAIPTKNFDPPPNDMRGLVAMPNGMMAAFAGKALRFCQPYQPHAWPRAYEQLVNDHIVGLCAIGSSLAVMTRGNPWLVQGLSPDQMAMVKVEAPFPCVSKRSIVDMGYAAIYASPLGLIQVGESGASLVSSALWTSEEWESLNPSSIEAARFGLSYIFSYLPLAGGVRKVAIVNLNGDQPSLVHCDLIARSFYADPESARCYFLDEPGKDVVEFDVGDRLTYTWRSKPYRFAEPIPLGACFVEVTETDPQGNQPGQMSKEGEFGQAVILSGATVVTEAARTITLSIPDDDIVIDGILSIIVAVTGKDTPAPLSIRFYGEGVLRHTETPVPGRPIRLPDGSYREWQFEIIGQADVLRVTVAQTLMEAGL